MRHWALASRDNATQPFVVLDKQRARLWLFDGEGLPLGDTPALLGAAKGDASVPGIGEWPMEKTCRMSAPPPPGAFSPRPAATPTAMTSSGSITTLPCRCIGCVPTCPPNAVCSGWPARLLAIARIDLRAVT